MSFNNYYNNNFWGAFLFRKFGHSTNKYALSESIVLVQKSQFYFPMIPEVT